MKTAGEQEPLVLYGRRLISPREALTAINNSESCETARVAENAKVPTAAAISPAEMVPALLARRYR